VAEEEEEEKEEEVAVESRRVPYQAGRPLKNNNDKVLLKFCTFTMRLHPNLHVQWSVSNDEVDLIVLFPPHKNIAVSSVLVFLHDLPPSL